MDKKAGETDDEKSKKQRKKSTSTKGRPKTSHISMQNRGKMKRRAGKGLQFEDDDSSLPTATTTEDKSHCFHETNVFTSHDDGSQGKQVGLDDCAKEKTLSCFNSSGSTQLSYTHQTSKTETFESKNQPPVSTLSQPVGSMHSQTAGATASEYSYAEHEMLDELFGGCPSLEPPTTTCTGVDVNDAAVLTASVSTSCGKDVIDDSDGDDGDVQGTHAQSIKFSDVGLCTPSVSMLRIDHREQGKQQKNSVGDGEGGSRNGGSSTHGDEDNPIDLSHSGDGTGERSKDKKTFNLQAAEEFNIDDLFGF